MTDSTVVEVLAQCEAKLMRLMDSVEGDQATQELDAQVIQGFALPNPRPVEGDQAKRANFYARPLRPTPW